MRERRYRTRFNPGGTLVPMEPPDVARAVRRLGVAPVALLALDVRSASDAASQRLSWVIVGLLVLAGLLTVTTVLFWRATRPPKASGDAMAMRWTGEEPPVERPAPVAGAAPPRPLPPLTATPAAPAGVGNGNGNGNGARPTPPRPTFTPAPGGGQHAAR